MRRRFIFTTLIVICLFLASSHAIAFEMPSKKQQALARLEKTEGIQVKWNEDTNTPLLLTGSISNPSKHTPAWIAYEFLNKYKSLYGLQNPHRDMEILNVDNSSPDVILIHLQHLLFHVPVWGDGLVFEIDRDGIIRRVEGVIHPELEKIHFNRPMHAAISKNQAISKAIASLGDLAIVKTVPECQTYYMPTRKGTPLIYVVKLQLKEPLNGVKLMLIHSLTGKKIE